MSDARLEAEWLEDLLNRWGPPKVEFYDRALTTEQGRCHRTGWTWFPGNGPQGAHTNNGLHLDRYDARIVVALWNHAGDPSQIEVTFRSEPTEDQMAALIALMWKG
jgi:hypothetical protein